MSRDFTTLVGPYLIGEYRALAQRVRLYCPSHSLYPHGELRLDYLARFNAPRADPNPFAAAGDLGLNRTKIDIPAPLGNIVRMRDLIAELRTLAADCTNLSHDQLQITYAFRRNMRQS
jgi:hypothetical protein